MAPCLLPFLPATPWYSGNKHEAKVDTRPEKLWAAVGCGCLILFLRVRGGRGLLSCKARWGRCQPLACCRDEQMDRGPLTVSFFPACISSLPLPFSITPSLLLFGTELHPQGLTLRMLSTMELYSHPYNNFWCALTAQRGIQPSRNNRMGKERPQLFNPPTLST